MSISYWCIIIAGLLPILTVAIAKWGFKDFDNAEPRVWLEKQSGFRRRADYAHRNHFEAFPFFAAAVLSSHVIYGGSTNLDLLAILFILLRLAYTAFYLFNQPTLRTFVWLLGLLDTLFIFALGPLKLAG